MKRHKWFAFILGCLTLLSIIGVILLRQGEATLLFAPPVIFTIFGIVILYLVLTSILNNAKERWLDLLLVGILLLGFSVLSIFSIGLYIAPVALFLLGLSIWKLLHQRIEGRTG
jgi:hypothetical protein